MPQTVRETLALAAANAAGIVASNTPAGAGNLTIVGGAPFVMDAPRRVLVTFGNEASNRLITITGTDRNGNSITETLTVISGAGGTIGTAQDFKTVTQVAVFAAWTAAMTVGTSGIASTRWFNVNDNIDPTSISVFVQISGTINWTVECTLEDPNISPPNGVSPVPFSPVAGLTAQAAAGNGVISQPIKAYRLTQNSFTNPGQATIEGLQAGLSN